jgi:hypothetical protein
LAAYALFELPQLAADRYQRGVGHAHAGDAHQRARTVARCVDEADVLMVKLQRPQLGSDRPLQLALLLRLVWDPSEAPRGLAGRVGSGFYGVECVIGDGVGQSEQSAH